MRDLYDDDDFDATDGVSSAAGAPTGDLSTWYESATEAALPWKRTNEEAQSCPAPLKQREFPAWLKNEDYMVHGTPSQDILRDMGQYYTTYLLGA